MKGAGTLIDVAAIAIFGLAGLAVGKRLDKQLQDNLVVALGLVAVASGLKMTVEAGQMLIVLISLAIGMCLGSLERFFLHGDMHPAKPGTAMEACIKASLISLIGPLAILGPMAEGSGKGIGLLLLKSGFDSISTFLLSATLGPGVLLSIIPIGAVQGGLTLLAAFFGKSFSFNMISGLSSVGGIIIFTVGLDLLGIKKIRTEPMLKALFIVPVVVLVGTKIGLLGP